VTTPAAQRAAIIGRYLDPFRGYTSAIDDQLDEATSVLDAFLGPPGAQSCAEAGNLNLADRARLSLASIHRLAGWVSASEHENALAGQENRACDGPILLPRQGIS